MTGKDDGIPIVSPFSALQAGFSTIKCALFRVVFSLHETLW